jgi:large subunit ribosomal protein L35
MSKLKTRRSAEKRYRKTKNGKFIFKRPFKSHILEKKSPKQRQHMSTMGVAAKGDARSITIMLPY